MVTSWSWARPWPRVTIDSLRVSVHRTGRPSSLARRGEQQLLGVHADLGPEPAADVGRHDAHAVGLDAVDRGERRGRPARAATTPTCESRPSTHAAAAARSLERARRQPLVDEPAGHDDLAAGEEVVAAQAGTPIDVLSTTTLPPTAS